MDIDVKYPVLFPDILRGIFEFYALECKEPEERDSSYQANLASYARVCRAWYYPAQECLWRHLGEGLSKTQGYFAPEIISALKRNDILARAVRTLHVTSTLDASLWRQQYANEGDCFADVVNCCPNLRKLTVASFENASKEKVLQALSGLKQLRSFEIRVYLESDRRSKSYSSLIPYFDFTSEICTALVTSWPRLEEFAVIHQRRPSTIKQFLQLIFSTAKDSYHIRPDSVLFPAPKCFQLPSHQASLTKLSLRETLIDDRTLFHLAGDNRLIELTLMSCQGITSSAITRVGLANIIRRNGATLEKLCIMTPWLASTGGPAVLDEAIKACPKLREIVVAGQDMTDHFFLNLHPAVRLEVLGITDFELITPPGLHQALLLPQLSTLKRLEIWQRNGGSNNGTRLTHGFLEEMFHSIRHWKLVNLLIERGICLGTGWESRLISGGSIITAPLRHTDTYAMPSRLILST